jgi:hypothetical protein
MPGSPGGHLEFLRASANGRTMKRWLPLFLSAALSACSGGSSTVLPGSPAASGSSGHTAATLTISIPRAAGASSAQRRSPAYISTATQSIAIGASAEAGQPAPAGFPLVANVTSSSPGCTTTQSATVCTIALPIPPGKYDASLTTYGQLNGSGSPLSVSTSIPVNIQAGRTNTLTFTLDAIPASLQILATGGQAANGPLVVTLPSNASGTLSAYALDASGATIVGPGAPSIAVTTDNAGQIGVTAPTAGAPNTIGILSQGTNAIAHITVTATPVGAAAGSAISQTLTVQPPTMSLLYLTSSYYVHVVDMTGTEITPPGAFPSLAQGAGGDGLAYDPVDGFIYVAVQASPSYIVAFSPAGLPETLGSGVQNLPAIAGLVYDPASNLIYGGNQSSAFDPGGGAHALTQGVSFYYNLTYDSTDHYVVAGNELLNADGSVHATLPFSGQITGVAYNPVNDLFYVSTVYPTEVTAYNLSGTAQVLTGSFIDGSSSQIGGIAADPATGNVFIATNDHHVYAFDSNGNALPAPWQSISAFGADSGDAGMAFIPPQ